MDPSIESLNEEFLAGLEEYENCEEFHINDHIDWREYFECEDDYTKSKIAYKIRFSKTLSTSEKAFLHELLVGWKPDLKSVGNPSKKNRDIGITHLFLSQLHLCYQQATQHDQCISNVPVIKKELFKEYESELNITFAGFNKILRRGVLSLIEKYESELSSQYDVQDSQVLYFKESTEYMLKLCKEYIDSNKKHIPKGTTRN